MEFKTIADAKRKTRLSYLGGYGLSGKLSKSEKKNNTLTYCIYLAPANTSGYNVCTHSTPECRKGCLATSGRARMEFIRGNTKIKNARIKKAKLFFEQRDFFMKWLSAEIASTKMIAENKKMNVAIRLNGTSDIDWNKVKLNNKSIFQHFSNIDFYDYTKDKNRFKNKPQNYYLTLSYTGRNWNDCVEVMKQGYNVAMVFNIPPHKSLPKEYKGYKVIDGDITDLRIKDKKGVIVGLHWKNIGDKKTNDEIKESIFVIQSDDQNVKY